MLFNSRPEDGVRPALRFLPGELSGSSRCTRRTVVAIRENV